MFRLLIWSSKVYSRNIQKYFYPYARNDTSAPAQVILQVTPNENIRCGVATFFQNSSHIVQDRSPNPKGNLQVGSRIPPPDTSPWPRVIFSATGLKYRQQLVIDIIGFIIVDFYFQRKTISDFLNSRMSIVEHQCAWCETYIVSIKRRLRIEQLIVAAYDNCPSCQCVCARKGLATWVQYSQNTQTSSFRNDLLSKLDGRTQIDSRPLLLLHVRIQIHESYRRLSCART